MDEVERRYVGEMSVGGGMIALSTPTFIADHGEDVWQEALAACHHRNRVTAGRAFHIPTPGNGGYEVYATYSPSGLLTSVTVELRGDDAEL